MRHKSVVHRLLRWTACLAAAVAILALLALVFWLRGALFNRLVRFPQEERAWAELRADRQVIPPVAGWREYRGIIHSHSHLSHDCEVSFEEILRVLEQTGRDFICLSDHPADHRADFDAQWRGLRGGKLFIPGFEMREGFMPFGVASGVVLDERSAGPELARRIVESGGVLFFAHPESPRDWERPELAGLEIYNIHAAFRESGGLKRLGPDILVNLRRYPDQVMRLIFSRPEAGLRRWDSLGRQRHIAGIAGNDAHQNTGIRGIYTADRTLRIEDTSPETIREVSLNAFTRSLLRLCFGPLEPGRRLFLVQLDTYERMARFVTTHVLARELSETAILDSLREGRAFVGFDMMADSTGFTWLAQSPAGTTVMGENALFLPDVILRAAAPNVCRFTIVKDGTGLFQQEGRSMEWKPPSSGKYRVEAELKIRGEWIPWVYSNPILLTDRPAR